MKPDFQKPPHELFALPGVDPSIQFFEPTPETWAVAPSATILAFPCSAFDKINSTVRKHMRFHYSQRRFSKVLEIRSHPAVLQNPSYFRSFVGVGDKWILNGASGTRLRNQFLNKYPGEKAEVYERYEGFFKQARLTAPKALPVVEDRLDIRKLDFAIECRNTFNFYHFIVETLGQLSVAVDLGVTGKVRIHSPTKEPAKFVIDWVADLYPELRGQVEFVHKPKQYDGPVLTSMNLLHGYPHLHDNVMPPLKEFGPKHSGVYAPRSANRHSIGALAMNSFDSSLVALRKRGLELSKVRVKPDMPERVWIGRKPGGKRERPMQGQDALLSALAKRGFVEVFLEDLSPLDQIALISNAKIIVAAHGAGVANMIFADASATVIELGHAHTAHYRWEDFIRLAHVAGCTYTNFFADMDRENPDTMDGVKSGSLPSIVLSAVARQQILSYIDELLGRGRSFKDIKQMRTLSDQLNLHQQFGCILKLSARHPKWMLSDPYLSTHLANAFKSRGDVRSALKMLRNAADLAPENRRMFERALRMVAQVDGVMAAQAYLKEGTARFPKQAAEIEERFRKDIDKPEQVTS